MNKKNKALVIIIILLLCCILCYLSFLIIDNLLSLDNMNSNNQKMFHDNAKKTEQLIEKTENMEDSKKNIIMSSCYGIIDAAKYKYINSMLYETVNSGSVLDLNISGTKPISGTWSIDSDGNIILSKVVIDGYECNTIDNSVDCFKIN